jgi:hypothetical protein
MRQGRLERLTAGRDGPGCSPWSSVVRQSPAASPADDALVDNPVVRRGLAWRKGIIRLESWGTSYRSSERHPAPFAGQRAFATDRVLTMLPARRVMGSVATSAVMAGLALVVVSVFGVVHWVATMIATLVIVAAMLLCRRI